MNDPVNIPAMMEDLGPILDSWWPYIITFIIGVLTTIRAYMAGPACPTDERIDGKVVVITGASSGIGKATALELAKRGGHIILAARNKELAQSVAKLIENIPGAKAEVKVVDLSCLKSIQAFAEQLEVNEVDILINNAAIVFHPREESEEGFELHFVTNYLGHFLLTQLLLAKLKVAKQGRVINITGQAYSMSSIHLDDLNLEKKFSAAKAFGQSKLAMIMMARHMSSILENTNVTINVVNPGLVRGTRHMKSSPINNFWLIKLIMQPWMWLLMKNPVQGAQSTVYAAVSSSLTKQSGIYISDCEVKTPDKTALNDKIAEDLYTHSMKLVYPFMKNLQNIDQNDKLIDNCNVE